MGDQDLSKESGAEHTITARDVVVRFGSIVALDNFSIQVPKGIVGLLGPNGAGKSTFIKTVLGLVSFESGEVRISGMDPRTDVMAIRDRVGYMPEHDCLPSQVSAAEFLTHMAEVSGLPENGKFLAAGVGRPREFYVLYPWNGLEVLCVGSVMQYYEYETSERLTDDAWRALLDSPAAPPLPAWFQPYAPPPAAPRADRD